MEPVLLLLLHRAPSHGYELLGALDSMGFADYPVDPSTVYRSLTTLEEEGMVASSMESSESLGPPRRVYSITPAGEEYLHAWVENLQKTDRLLHCFLSEYERRFSR